MSYTLELSTDRRLATVRHFGVVEGSEFEGITSEIEGSIEGSLPFLLIDVREAVGYPNKADFLLWLRNRRPRPRVGKIALITNESYEDTVEFIALASKNSGFDIEYFHGEDDARSWLLETPGPN